MNRLAHAALAIVVALAAGCNRSGNRTVPAELHGRWVAEDGAHAGLAFEIDSDRLVIVDAEGGVTDHAIRRVDVATNHGTASYELTITGNAGSTEHFRVWRTEEQPDVLVLERVGGVRWVRDQAT